MFVSYKIESYGDCFERQTFLGPLTFLPKAGLVVGPLRLSVHSFVCSFVRASVRPSVRNTFGVPSLCNL